MPLGDPHGGDFDYTTEGLPLCVTACTVPVGDLKASVGFYERLLGFETELVTDRYAIIRRSEAVLVLVVSPNAGKDTGIYLGVDNPFDLHRRLIDEGVVFVRDPAHSPLGVYVSFCDNSGNTIHAVDMMGKMERKPE